MAWSRTEVARETTFLSQAARCAAAAFWLVLTEPATAHRATPATVTTGVSIPAVTHGQMVVLAAHRTAILALAESQYPTDGRMRQIQAFINLQYFYCAGGLFPGSATDESSPFNECTHAYLAGLRALLLHLETMPGDRSAVRALARRIDGEMLDRHASMVLCQFSEEPFNTAEVIIPAPGAILAHPTCRLVLLVLALAALGCGATVAHLRTQQVRS